MSARRPMIQRGAPSIGSNNERVFKSAVGKCQTYQVIVCQTIKVATSERPHSNGVVIEFRYWDWRLTLIVRTESVHYHNIGLASTNYTGQKLRQTRNQRGRWNHRLSNTKLFPIISECRDTSGNLTSVIQSKNLFINTDYKMPKHKLMSYLARNAKYLHR